MKITCQVCGSLNKKDNEFCNSCGVKLSMDNDEEEIAREDKLEIAKDKIILLDLNYTLIANSKEIWNYPLDKKIKSQKYEMDLIDLIKDSLWVIASREEINIINNAKNVELGKKTALLSLLNSEIEPSEYFLKILEDGEIVAK